MGGSYKQCLQCGKRALSIATRCPGCGQEFPAPELPQDRGIRELGRFLTPGTLVGIFALIAIFTVGRLGRIGQPEEELSAFAPAESVADFSEVESSTATTAPLDSARIATLAAASAGEVLVARDWTNVRTSRSVGGALEAMLMPGDTVLADSLERGWYRVALEGEVLGYAHRSTLMAP